MQLHCLTGRHDSDLQVVANQGFRFSRCRSCGENLVRSGARWRPVPAGFRIVWKPVERAVPGGAAAVATLSLNCAAGTAARLRAPRPAQSRPWLKNSAFVLASLALAGLRLLLRQGVDKFFRAGPAFAAPAPRLALAYAKPLALSSG